MTTKVALWPEKEIPTIQTNMLGDNETLRRLWCGPFLDLALKFNGGKGPEFEEQLNKLLRGEMMPIPISVGTAGITIVKTVPVRIGGGRTTDQIIKAAKNLKGKNRPNYINPSITQANMPSGNGRVRVVLVEWFEFDHDPTMNEVRAQCEEPGYGYSHYEDGLRFQEDRPDDQRERPHVLIPENPWCDADGFPQALFLWSFIGDRKLDLDYYDLEYRWHRRCVFARRKYLLL